MINVAAANKVLLQVWREKSSERYSKHMSGAEEQQHLLPLSSLTGPLHATATFHLMNWKIK